MLQESLSDNLTGRFPTLEDLGVKLTFLEVKRMRGRGGGGEKRRARFTLGAACMASLPVVLHRLCDTAFIVRCPFGEDH